MLFWALLLEKRVSLIMGHVQMQIKVSTLFLAVITKEYHKISEPFNIKCFFIWQKRVIHIKRLLSTQEDCTPV